MTAPPDPATSRGGPASTPPIVVHHDLPIADALRDRRPEWPVVDAADPAMVVDALGDPGVLVTKPSSWHDTFLDALPPGSWIQSTAAGYAAYPIDALRDADVVLCSAAGLHDASVADHVMALALATSRRLPTLIDAQRTRTWDRSIGTALTDWDGRDATIVGLGHLGEAVAERARGFGLAVRGLKRTPSDYDGCLPRDHVLGPDALRDVLPDTDLLVLTVPLTPETRGLVDRDVLRRLPDTAVLVNVARGPVVDQHALVAALEAGDIAAAGLDVFETEPLPDDSPLWTRDDVVITPHIAGRSDRFVPRLADLFDANLDRFLAGDPLENAVT